MLRNLAVVALALIGDMRYVRFTFSLAVGFGAVCLVYWLLPMVLPLWPAVAIIVVAAVVGLLWERKALANAGLR